MKKTYKLITAFIVLLSFVTLKMGAQISGTVTINSGSPTGGTNYQTFTALATALSTSGISGPLTVNVVASTGPYVEQPSFGIIPGVSATNTITVNGNGNTLSFSATSSNAAWTINLNGAQRMAFNNLNVLATGASYGYVCLLSAGADYNMFTSCTFSCPAGNTSGSMYPVLFSGVNTGVSGGINSANHVTFESCGMYNGYYGVYMYGYTGAPYQQYNTISNCTVRDFYYMGVYCYYQKYPTVRGCTVDRPTRTAGSSVYGMYLYGSQGGMFERNRVQQLFDGMQTTTNYAYCIYFAYNPVPGAAYNTLRNNIVSDIKSNGGIYGIYGYYPDGYVYHNTISLDHTASTQNSSTYGISLYGTGGYLLLIKNNIVSITRGGTGTKYCYYGSGVTGNITLDKNDYFLNAAGGTNYIGYYTSPVTTLAALQSQGIDPNSYSTDPMFTLLPGNVIPTSTVINNQGAPLGVVTDYQNLPRSSTNPDIGAHEFLSISCVGTPSANTVVTPTYAICPNNSANLGLGTYYSDLGITYQWQASTTSSVGPWTTFTAALVTATNVLLSTPSLTQSTWFSVKMTCSNGGGSIQPVGEVIVAGTTTNTVPYNEGFELIPTVNVLPNCSWSATGLGSTCLTYTSSNTLGRVPHNGTSFASFFYSPSGANYFYTNGIYLNAGITYSAALWYETEYYGYNNWSDLSILYGTTQTTTGLVSIASTNGPAVSNIYKLLSNTFTVSASGLYYIAVRGTAVSGSAQYLTWDDLSITIPCSANSPTIALTANTTSVCSGSPVLLTAGGADTYTWSTGANTNAITDMPSVNTTYVVLGTSTLSGCTTTMTQMVTVNPAPTVLVFVNNSTVCAGQAVNLTALGATSYTWSTGSNNNVLTVSPTVNITYTVLGSNSIGCTGLATQAINVNPLPTINVTSSQPNVMCSGETQMLTATGGVSYVWVSSSGAVLQGSPANINPTSTTIYTVTGTNANGCSNKATITQNVSDCLGLKENKSNNVRIYPNPTAGEFTVELNNVSEKTVEVMDLTGRVISSSTGSQESVKVNIANLANGIYYVKIQSNTSVEVVKIVKQ